MGAGQSLNDRAMHYGVQEFTSENWSSSQSVLKRTSSTAKLHVVSEECKPIATYSSATHAFLIDEYLLQPEDVPNIEAYLQEIQWRNLSEYLVNVRYIKGFTFSTICESVSSPNYLYIEHIPLRLSQITDIPFPDNLYLLKACLKGFQYIFLHTHGVEIKEDHVCINEIGRVKIWMNSNLAKNVPTVSNAFKTTKKSELALVRDIINMVDDNTDHQYEPINFKQHLKEHKLENLTFSEAIEAVEQFASAFQIHIPSALLSVGDLFDPLLSNHRTMFKHKNFTVYNSYSAQRGAETNETKMLESVPLQQDQSIHQTKNSQYHQFINFIDTYTSPKIENAINVPIQQIQLNQPQPQPQLMLKPQLQLQSRSQLVPRITFINRQLSRCLPNQQKMDHVKEMKTQSSKVQIDTLKQTEDWKYFDKNGWLDIDPEILQDLKNVSRTS